MIFPCHPMSSIALFVDSITVLLYIDSSFKRSERWYAVVEWLDKAEITSDPRFHQDMLKRCTGNDMIINQLTIHHDNVGLLVEATHMSKVAREICKWQMSCLRSPTKSGWWLSHPSEK